MMVTATIESDGFPIEARPSQACPPAPLTPLKYISAMELQALHSTYVETPLPSGTLFPWLHGVDGHSPQQNAFFEIESMAGGLPIPAHRGLIFVHASDLDCGRLVGSVSPSELLEPVPATTSLPSSAHYHDTHAPKPTTVGTPTPSSEEEAATAAEHVSLAAAAVTTSGTDSAHLLHTTASNSGVMVASADSSADSSFFLSDDSTSFDSTSSTNAQALVASLTPIAKSTPSMQLLQPRFLSTETEGINIRNFRIQVARYATISNIVVYGSGLKQPTAAASSSSSSLYPGPNHTSMDDDNGSDRQGWLEHILGVAKLISEAQEEFFLRMLPYGMRQRCETFVLTEPFQQLEQVCPQLIAIDSAGRPTQHNVDFWEQEREKMALLTRASEIAPGVWLGNHTDVPTTHTDARSLATPVSPGPEHSSYFASITSCSSPTTTVSEAGLYPMNKPSTPPNDYPPLIPPISTITSTAPQPSVCIECRSGAIAPSHVVLDGVRSGVCSAPAPLPTKEIFHLECSGSLTNCVDPGLFPPSTSSLNNHTGFYTCEAGVTPRSLLPSREEISALHATQRSMAAQIVQKGSESSNAILRTQISQLVEMTFLVERLVNEPPQQPSQRQHQVLLHCVDGYTDTSLLALSYIMLHYKLSLAEAYVKLQVDLGRSFFVYPNDALMMLQVEERIWDTILERREEAEAMQDSIDTDNKGTNTPMETEDDWRIKPYHRLDHDLEYGWFYHHEFEGSFPSRILPFLYLGNLAHASNPGLLQTLGIHHVLSVGEATGLGQPNEGYNLNIMLVEDMFDNGIDSLWGHLEQCVHFIELARRAQSRVLIHCRVGVSRSATIVIAYLMARYRLSLVDAYLTVRARRLSVIIQPNLLFMYELLQWDQRLRGRFDALGWTGIAREIHTLNRCYIGG